MKGDGLEEAGQREGPRLRGDLQPVLDAISAPLIAEDRRAFVEALKPDPLLDSLQPKRRCAWDDARQRVLEGAREDVVLRLSPGDTVLGVICGEPYTREAVWQNGRWATVRTRVAEELGAKIVLRIALNIFVDGRMHIIEFDSKSFRDVLKVRDRYGLDKWYFEIIADPNYVEPGLLLSILPCTQLSPEKLEAIAEVALYDLEKLDREGRL